MTRLPDDRLAELLEHPRSALRHKVLGCYMPGETAYDLARALRELQEARAIVDAIATRAPRHGGCPYCDLVHPDPLVHSVTEHEDDCPIKWAQQLKEGTP